MMIAPMNRTRTGEIGAGQGVHPSFWSEQKCRPDDQVDARRQHEICFSRPDSGLV
jgi:hypothetical protein